MQKYTIPRNIKIKESFMYGFSGKQVLYIGGGLFGALTFFATAAPLDVKIAGSVLSVSLSAFISLKKIHGQDIDKYMVNSIKYSLRQKEFGGDDNEKAVVCNFRYNIR